MIATISIVIRSSSSSSAPATALMQVQQEGLTMIGLVVGGRPAMTARALCGMHHRLGSPTDGLLATRAAVLSVAASHLTGGIRRTSKGPYGTIAAALHPGSSNRCNSRVEGAEKCGQGRIAR